MSNSEIIPPLPKSNESVFKKEKVEEVEIPSGKYQVLDAKIVFETLLALSKKHKLENIPIRVWINPDIERDLKDVSNPINNMDFYLKDADSRLHSIDLSIWE